MDWKLVVIGLVMTVAGGAICWRMRQSSFMVKAGPGCVMALGLLLVGTGLLCVVFSVGFGSG